MFSNLKTAEITSCHINDKVINIPASIVYDGVAYSVTSIGRDAFYDRGDLVSITIPNSVTNIGVCAFIGCSGLTSITIPNSVTNIEDSAFSGCKQLKSLLFLSCHDVLVSMSVGE